MAMLIYPAVWFDMHASKENCKECYRAFELCHEHAVNLSNMCLEPINVTNETIGNLFKLCNQIKVGAESDNRPVTPSTGN